MFTSVSRLPTVRLMTLRHLASISVLDARPLVHACLNPKYLYSGASLPTMGNFPTASSLWIWLVGASDSTPDFESLVCRPMSRARLFMDATLRPKDSIDAANSLISSM